MLKINLKGLKNPLHSAKKECRFMRAMTLIRKVPYIKMFTKKRSNKGVVWASLISLGATAAVWGMTKVNKKEKTTVPIGKMFSNMISNKNMPNMNNAAALTEFSEELVSDVLNKKE
jgi:hypothetical protein